MSATIKEIKKVVSDVLAEAKKKKEKAIALKHDPKPPAYGYAEAFDFSAPLGAYNLYRNQGPVNWGPMTSAGTKIDDKIVPQRERLEAALRGIQTEAAKPSSWERLSEAVDPQVPGNVWEAANHWYDHAGFGLGHTTSENIEEKKIGFAKLKAQLAKKKGVHNPGALAAAIGRKKYGKVGMAKKSAAGRK